MYWWKIAEDFAEKLTLRSILKDHTEFSTNGKEGLVGKTILENMKIGDSFKLCYSLNIHFLLHLSSSLQGIKIKHLC